MQNMTTAVMNETVSRRLGRRPVSMMRQAPINAASMAARGLTDSTIVHTLFPRVFEV